MPKETKTSGPARSRRAKGTPAGRRRTLSREMIIAAAIAVIDRESPSSLSLHKVAAELGVYPTTIYTYFETLDELRDASQSFLLQDVPLPSRDDAMPLRDQLIRYFEGLRKLYIRHPGFMRIEVGSSSWLESLRHYERVLAVLLASGVKMEQAWVILRIGEGLVLTSVQNATATSAKDYMARQRDEVRNYRGEGLNIIKRMLELPEMQLPADEAFHKMLDYTFSVFFPKKKAASAR